MNGNETKTTESQNIRNNDIPWFKKKNTIIGASSILGVGALVTVITVPIVLTQQTVDPVQDTIATLNAEGNKAVRIGIWNQYMATLTTTARAAVLNTIVRTPEFITEFISFLTTNLYENEATPTVEGSVTKAELTKIVAEISSTANQALFKDTALATYTKLFEFSTGGTAMFTFKNKTTAATTEFSLFMPMAGLDLIYNTDETISVKILAHDKTTKTNNVRLNINAFADPAITSSQTKDIYFKADTIIKLPSTVMVDFKSYLKTTADTEVTNRGKIVKSLTDIKTNIESDATNAKGLSYWNSFALNYATSNIAFLKADFVRDAATSGMYKFLAANAKKADGTLITSTELTALKTQLTTEATNGLSTSPFVSSPANSNLLFNTSNTSESKYSLSLNITKFNYDFVVNNLFVGANAIVITPKLELSGSLSITPAGANATATTFTIANGTYDVGSLINMTYGTEFASGGLTGFFTQLSNPNPNQLSKLTNSLATLNGNPIDKQIAFWNTFAKATASNTLILTELKKAGVLSNFILNNIDITNLVGTIASGGSLPTIDVNTLKTSIDTAAASLSTADLSFTSPGVAAITLNPAGGMAYHTTDATNDKFASITIYFGYEANSISNFNVISKLDSATSTAGTSNISLSQTVESTTTFADKTAVETAAKKRISVVFDKTTTANAAKASTLVAFFGQTKLETKQVTKPIIISSSILTSATKFIDAISPPATVPAK